MNLPRVQDRPNPVGDLVTLLRPRGALWGGGEGAGAWGLSFPAQGDLLICWLQHGRCALVSPNRDALALSPGDVVLIRAARPFALVSSPEARPTDSAAAPRGPDNRFRLGGDAEPQASIHAARLVFGAADAGFLLTLLPEIVHLAGTAPAAERTLRLLQTSRDATDRPDGASGFVVARLLEAALAQLLAHAGGAGEAKPGLVAGLSDPVTARALLAIHHRPAEAWTVAKLAAVAGASRSAFSPRFRARVGESPIRYLAQWRLALAKDDMRRGSGALEEIALRVGFSSASAFSTAFRRATGRPPSRFTRPPDS